MIKLTRVLLFVVIFSGCQGDAGETGKDGEIKNNTQLAKTLDPAATGIDFANTLTETDVINRLSYEYFYNGGGVAAGDINNDGLADLYFTGNMVPDKLYLNKGNMQFEDITQTSGIQHEADWHTGVTMVDINQDGLLDIYVNRSGWYRNRNMLKNRLYVNEGNSKFREAASEYGLDDAGYSVQTIFFDAENDGDLDALVLNNPEEKPNVRSLPDYAEAVRSGNYMTDRFYEQENGKFIERSAKWGFKTFGYRHGVIASDFNNDGYTDLYISSDFDDPDYLYINQAGKGFKDELLNFTNHITMFSMGCDAADINRDGWMDFMVVDMTPADHQRSKQNMASMQPEKFTALTNIGFHHQYMANSLQLNTGANQFKEISNLAGVAYTDWSWATLFLDWDLDGWEDIFVTNGVKRDVLNNDVRILAAQLARNQAGNVEPMQVLNLMPSTKLKNVFYRNTGNLKFEHVTDAWSDAAAVNSNGAAFVDLDNDGDLDLAVNNADDPASIIENQSADKLDHHYLKVVLKGPDGNRSGIGTRVTLSATDKTQTRIQQFTRGFNSSVDPALHFGLGTYTGVVRIEVHWPGGNYQVIEDVPVDQLLTIDYKPTGQIVSEPSQTYFTALPNLPFRHIESNYNDFQLEILLPHKQSTVGPPLLSKDVDGDGLDDLFVGGGARQAGVLFMQDATGQFSTASLQPWTENSMGEDQSALFVDVDNDGDDDLYVGRGSNEFSRLGPTSRDGLYLNAEGKFILSNGLPDAITNTGAVAAADVDGDGDQDIFVGGRSALKRYPYAAESYLLINDGKGNFTKSSDLPQLGMIASAKFGDMDGDGDPDLIAAGPWTDILWLENEEGRLSIKDNWKPRDLKGWWQFLELIDINQDGQLDIFAGNIGLNNKFHPSDEKIFKVFADDFDQNGTIDIVLSKQYQGNYVPVRGRECSSDQMPFIADKFPTFKGFSEASIDEILGQDQLTSALTLEANEFGSMILLSDGGSYKEMVLPYDAQTGPVRDMEMVDVNNDGYNDLIVVGNLFGAEPETVRYDGLGSLLLLGNSAGSFTPVNASKSGLTAFEDERSIEMVNNRLVIAGSNDVLRIFELNQGVDADKQ